MIVFSSLHWQTARAQSWSMQALPTSSQLNGIKAVYCGLDSLDVVSDQALNQLIHAFFLMALDQPR
jgi:hypothetical protein